MLTMLLITGAASGDTDNLFKSYSCVSVVTYLEYPN